MLHGLLLVNKEGGMSSHDVVARLRRILGTKEIGHTGTLDPIASGLMVLLVGEATKLSQYILDGDKAYRAQGQFGLTTDTLDVTGEVLSEHAHKASEAEIVQMAHRLIGPMELPVPIYSAVKVKGKELYKYARQDEEVSIPVKSMNFYEAKLEKIEGTRFQVYLRCSKGSYIRSWIHLLGQKLGSGAIMTGLHRVESAPYFVDASLRLDEIEAAFQGKLEKLPNYIPMESALPQLRTLRVGGQDLHLMSNGTISNSLKSQIISMYRPGSDLGIKVLSQPTSQLVAIIELEEGKGFKIKRVFRY